MSEKLTVTIDGISMDFAKFGNGKKVFVIIPGISVKKVTDSPNAVERRYSQFKDNYTVYVFDRRNNLNEGYSITDMADDTVKVLRYLGVESASFFGSSQGGMICMTIAANYPEMADALVVCSTSLFITTDVERVFNEWITLANDLNGEALAHSFAKLIYSKKIFEKYSAVLEKPGKSFTVEELRRFVICAKAELPQDADGLLRRIKAPMFAVAAKGDVIFGTEPTVKIAGITGCESYIYGEEYGHAVYDEAPDFADRIFAFFNSVKL